MDLTRGVVLGGTRARGLAGAYTAVAEGLDGAARNPAAVAHRLPWSFSDFDYQLGLGVAFPGLIGDGDFFNSGSGRRDLGASGESNSFVFVEAGLILQWGKWGLGGNGFANNYTLTPDRTFTATDSLDGIFTDGELQLGRAFFNQQLLLGGGIHASGFAVRTGLDPIFTVSTVSATAGALLRPFGYPFRLGIMWRSPSESVPLPFDLEPTADGDRVVEVTDGRTLYLPEKVVLPWEVTVGVAVQVGPRPLNIAWWNPERVLTDELRRIEADEADGAASARTSPAHKLRRARKRAERVLRRRVEKMPRAYLLLTADVSFRGALRNAVGVESFFTGIVDRSGELATLTPSFGAETEAIPRLLKIRGGTYLEPTRFNREGAAPRLHGTAGFDLRLFQWNALGLVGDDAVWMLSTAVDVAPRYLGTGLSLGHWH